MGEKQEVSAVAVAKEKSSVIQEVTLKRDLGVLGSFSIGFADVGADIYVALGLVLFFAMGAAPLALAVAALGYMFTALSYAELASAIPRAGGASVFAREAFNDFWGFIAGWGLLLDYTIDIALFGWITLGYLGSFCLNLGNAGVPLVGAFSSLNSLNTVALGSGLTPDYTYQAIATIALALGLMALNYIGIKESSNFNITLSIISIISEVALLFVGFFIVWNYDTFVHSITSLGATGAGGVSLANFGWGITVAMVSFIGLESISQAAEETKRPDKTIPRATLALIVAVILAGLLICVLAVGLPTMTASEIGHQYQNDPVAGVAAGIAKGLPLGNPLITILPLYVGFLGFAMLLMSTNTGVIGASRVTYSMARYNTFPTWFSHIHPKYRVPTRTVVVFTLASIGFVIFVWFMGTYGAQLNLPREDPTIILGDLYNYGALISFMLVNLALIHLRNKRPDLYRPFRSPITIHVPMRVVGSLVQLFVRVMTALVATVFARFLSMDWILVPLKKINVRSEGHYELPLMPLLGFFVCLSVWILVLSLHEIGKYVGTLWFIVGIAIYLYYRRRRKLHWKDSIAGTLETHPDVAHNLHPEIAHTLIRKTTKEETENEDSVR